MFDTHKAIRKLRDRGHSEGQAEATVEVIQDATDALVTREYLDSRLAEQTAALETRMAGLESSMAGLESRMETRMAGLETRMAGIEARMDGLEAKMEAQTAQLRAEMYRALWFFGTGIVAAVGTIVAVASALA